MARPQANVEVVIDMTPMIDLTFLLIIFFIVVNDLSKTELEDLKLPIAIQAGKDVPPPNRPILNVRWYAPGKMPAGVQKQYQQQLGITVPNDVEWCDVVWKRQILYHPYWDPAGHMDPIRKTRPDPYWKVGVTMKDAFLPLMTFKMDETLNKLLPDDPILIRADRNTPFKYIQKLMEVCTRDGIMIWKVQIAASEDPAAVAAREAARAR
jgi:biopolymer transport protein ExbD